MADALMFGPPIALGIIIGIYEILIIHRDVTVPTHRFGHGTHALILAVLFTLATMNASFVLGLIPALKGIPLIGTALGLQIALGLIAAVKIHGVSRVVRTTGMTGRGLAETWFHSLLVGGLIVAAPYIYPFIAPILPNWITGW